MTAFFDVRGHTSTRSLTIEVDLAPDVDITYVRTSLACDIARMAERLIDQLEYQRRVAEGGDTRTP